MSGYSTATLPNLGFLIAEFSEEELKPLYDAAGTSFADEIINRPQVIGQLAGNLKTQLWAADLHEYMTNLITPFCKAYLHEYDYQKYMQAVTGDFEFFLDDPWINFQEKGEVNPQHNHSGFFSYVIWLQVPYTIEEELAHPSCVNSNTKVAGHFEFSYTNILGGIETALIPADKTFEGKGIIFPSAMRHAVYPFFTGPDSYRISVAGNVFLKASQNQNPQPSQLKEGE